MAGDELLNPGFGGTQRFGQETSAASGPLGEYGEYGSYATSPLIGQDYDRQFASAVFTTTHEVVVTDDGFTEIPLILVESQSRQFNGSDSLLGDFEPVLGKESDLLLGGEVEGDSGQGNADQSALIIQLRDEINFLRQQVKSQQETIHLLSQRGPKYDLRGAKFQGGLADSVGGDQISNIQKEE